MNQHTNLAKRGYELARFDFPLPPPPTSPERHVLAVPGGQARAPRRAGVRVCRWKQQQAHEWNVECDVTRSQDE